VGDAARDASRVVIAMNRVLGWFVVGSLVGSLCSGCVGAASAAPRREPERKPKIMDKQNASPEQVLKAHFAKQSKELIEVTEEDLPSLAPSFWVRYKAGGGGLVIVRGDAVYADKGDATIAAILKADQQLTSKRISAADFLYLVENLGEMPELGSDVLTKHGAGELNPKWVFGKDDAQFVVHAPNKKATRPGGGAPAGEALSLHRATLTVNAKYELRWKVEQVTHSSPSTK
jgi:hypothetical protein